MIGVIGTQSSHNIHSTPEILSNMQFFTKFIALAAFAVLTVTAARKLPVCLCSLFLYLFKITQGVQPVEMDGTRVKRMMKMENDMGKVEKDMGTKMMKGM